MRRHGFLRVAAACPKLRLADPAFNLNASQSLLQLAQQQSVDLVVFPELGVTGYTCGDLFHQEILLRSARRMFEQFLDDVKHWYQGIVVLGLPLECDGRLFNCAVVVAQGEVQGVVPKTFLPNYNEFYDARYFAPASVIVTKQIVLGGRTVPFGTDLLFVCENFPEFVLAIEICEDLWVPIPPSSYLALAGATVIGNLSASNETIGKTDYRRQLIAGQSARCLAGYIYCSSGPGESSTDLVFGGHSLIAENGTILAESRRFDRQPQLTVADLDLQHLQHDRLKTTSFAAAAFQAGNRREIRRIAMPLTATAAMRSPRLMRPLPAHPFVPSDTMSLRNRCEEIFLTQVTGLVQRLEHLQCPPVCIGVSGGLDSTLALLVTCRAFDTLNEPRSKIHALTMPGFGTTPRTKRNADSLMTALGVSAREIDIRPLAFEELHALRHKPFGISLDNLDLPTFQERLSRLTAEQRHDLVFENVQARIRTNLLMNTAFVIGTGDLSELALGWCTYNADHMSMYNPNVSIPKTLVKFLVNWLADTEFTGSVQQTLRDIVATVISPELLPSSPEATPQSTEATIGPYELHDFFLYHYLRWGSSPDKILFLAEQAEFHQHYPREELLRWLKIFFERFFASQYKRSCLPDGPKVGTVSLSPRGDWRMPSDAVVTTWLQHLNQASASDGV